MHAYIVVPQKKKILHKEQSINNNNIYIYLYMCSTVVTKIHNLSPEYKGEGRNKLHSHILHYN